MVGPSRNCHTLWYFAACLIFLVPPPLVHAKTSKFNKTETKLEDKISRSHTCSVLQHPFVVSLQHALRIDHHFCAGTLLSEYWVLTAKICLKNQPCEDLDNFTVVAGVEVVNSNVNRPDGTKVQTAKVLKCYPHPKPDVEADIGLIKLRSPIHKAENVQFVKLPFSDNSQKNNISIDESLKMICQKQVLAVGWSQEFVVTPRIKKIFNGTFVNSSLSLTCDSLTLISLEECRTRMKPEIVQHTFICTEGESDDACYGDFGGPLICRGIQFGIISNGKGCKEVRFPRFHTRVWHFEEFIKSTMAGKPYPCEDDNCRSSSSAVLFFIRVFNTEALVVVFTLNYFNI